MARGLLVLLVFVFAFAAAPAGADSYETITVKSLAVKFSLPVSWSKATLKPELETHPPDNSAFLRILDAQTSMSLDALGKNFAQGELVDLKKKDPKATVVVSNATEPGGKAVRVTMRYQGTWVSHKTAITRVIYFMKKGKRAYEFDFGAAEAYAKQRPVFDHVIKSVRLLGGTTA